MADVFKEQLVKKCSTAKDTRKKLLYSCALACVVIVSLFIFRNLVATIFVGILMCIILAFIFRRMNIEYEYIYTNGELDIDCIYNKSKRKNVFSGLTTNFEVMAHIDDSEHLGEFSEIKCKDFSSGEILGNTYVFVTNLKNNRVKIIFEPNEDILNAIRTDIPRKLFKK